MAVLSTRIRTWLDRSRGWTSPRVDDYDEDADSASLENMSTAYDDDSYVDADSLEAMLTVDDDPYADSLGGVSNTYGGATASGLWDEKSGRWRRPHKRSALVALLLLVLLALPLALLRFGVFDTLYRDLGQHADGLGALGELDGLDGDPEAADRARFIADVLENPIEGRLDPAPIRRLCDQTVWREGLVWQCEELRGGIGNAESMFLNCVRYAIEAGATTLVIPRILARGDNLIDFDHGESNHMDASLLFDVDHFVNGMRASCPPLRVVADPGLVKGLRPLEEAPRLVTSEIGEFDMVRFTVVDMSGWRAAFDRWVGATAAFANMSAETPVRLWQQAALLEFYNGFDPADFLRSFPRLFRHPVETRELAAATLWELSRRLGRPVAVQSPEAAAPPPSAMPSFISASISGISALFSPWDSPVDLDDDNDGDDNDHGGGDDRAGEGSARPVPHAFLGAHLRVEGDASAAGWPGYEAQAPLYIQEALDRNLSAVYLATGSEEGRARFRADAAAANLTVLTKEDLLPRGGRDLARLGNLTFDQQGLVDFDVLLRASGFVGFAISSFSWAIAMRRAAVAGAGEPARGDALGDAYSWRDELSLVVGHDSMDWPRAMWP